LLGGHSEKQKNAVVVLSNDLLPKYSDALSRLGRTYNTYLFWNDNQGCSVLKAPSNDRHFAMYRQKVCDQNPEQSSRRNSEFLLLSDIAQVPAVFIDGYAASLAVLEEAR